MEDKVKREKIPKRATMINSCFFVLFAFTSAIFFFTEFDLDTKTLIIALSNAIANALRNPVIARLAFHVNNQIMRQTVEDRRNDEIKAALEKREERRNQREQQSGNPDSGRILTVSELVENRTRGHTLPTIEV